MFQEGGGGGFAEVFFSCLDGVRKTVEQLSAGGLSSLVISQTILRCERNLFGFCCDGARRECGMYAWGREGGGVVCW